MNKDIINEGILEFSSVFLIDETGFAFGKMPSMAALSMARNKFLDIVCISLNNDSDPICKITDYGKFKFEREKKRREAKKRSVKVDVKEIQLTYTIADHDMITKGNRAKRFLSDGNNVRIVLRLRGRELSYTDLAKNKVEKFLSYCGEFQFQKEIFFKGRDIITIIEPKREK